MNAVINKSVAKGCVPAPPSKSAAHRLLICGALANGISTVENISFSDDITATINCLKDLGADVEIVGSTVKIGNLLTNFKPSALNCFESGSTLRFLIPICLHFGKEIKLSGTNKLFSRSLSVYSELSKAQGFCFEESENSVTVSGKLKGGKIEIRGDISSQFVSGLLFVLPLLNTDSELVFTTEIESKPYIELTVDVLQKFGVSVAFSDKRTIFIKGNQHYSPQHIITEGDFSNASFLDAFNLFGGRVNVTGLNEKSCQGDKIYAEFFEKLNRENAVIDIKDYPDLAPILMAVASLKHGGTFIGTRRLKIKESDRGASMAAELAEFGVSVTVEENTITVTKPDEYRHGAVVCGHNDHRIVMALSVVCSVLGGTIVGAQAVKKSYPGFFEVLKDLELDIKVLENEDR